MADVSRWAAVVAAEGPLSPPPGIFVMAMTVGLKQG
jgi:hypothetical protein